MASIIFFFFYIQKQHNSGLPARSCSTRARMPPPRRGFQPRSALRNDVIKTGSAPKTASIFLIASLCGLTIVTLLFSKSVTRSSRIEPLLRSWSTVPDSAVGYATGATAVAVPAVASAQPRTQEVAPQPEAQYAAPKPIDAGAAPATWAPPISPLFVVDGPPAPAREVRTTATTDADAPSAAVSTAAHAATTTSAGAPPAAVSTAAHADACPPTYRGVLDPSAVVRALRWVRVDDGAVRFAHAVPAADCEKWVRVTQNTGAGLGHRLRQWSTSLWLATALPPPTRVAFAHTSVDEGQGAHHSYKGFDEFLGLALGEGPLGADALVSSGAAKEAPELERANGPHAYVPNDGMVRTYGGRMASAGDCGVVYRLPVNMWAEDHSTATRGISAWKFAAAAAARAAAGARLPLSPPDEWDPAAVHIGVHLRVNDGYLITEETLAAVLRDYALSALAAARVGARVKIHIFTEEEGVGKTPAIHALAAPPQTGAPLPAGVDVHEVLVDPRSALWMMSQTDVFVGSVSSFSWIVAQFSTRPAALLQDWQDGGTYTWCLTGAGCCQRDGTCDAAAEALMAETAARLARMHSCGQLSRASWEDEADLPGGEPEGETGPSAAGP
jgi:hypothetical protein